MPHKLITYVVNFSQWMGHEKHFLKNGIEFLETSKKFFTLQMFSSYYQEMNTEEST